jgi:hypothetical protein
MDVKINGNKISSVLEVVIFNGTSAILFIGYDSEQGKWFDKYKATVQSIKF